MKQVFGFLLFDKLEELDFAGPWEMIGVWRNLFNGPQKVVTVSQHGGLVTCDKGLRIVSDYSFSKCPQLDYLLVPGGQGTRIEVENKILLDFIFTQAAHCKSILSVCTGSFLLQAAGLLRNCRATTHWLSLERLKRFSDLKITEKRYVEDGNIWTSAGISAGIDMTLAFIANEAGEEVAGKIQMQTEYFPENKLYGTLDKTANLPDYIEKLVDSN